MENFKNRNDTRQRPRMTYNLPRSMIERASNATWLGLDRQAASTHSCTQTSFPDISGDIHGVSRVTESFQPVHEG